MVDVTRPSSSLSGIVPDPTRNDRIARLVLACGRSSRSQYPRAAVAATGGGPDAAGAVADLAGTLLAAWTQRARLIPSLRSINHKLVGPGLVTTSSDPARRQILDLARPKKPRCWQAVRARLSVSITGSCAPSCMRLWQLLGACRGGKESKDRGTQGLSRSRVLMTLFAARPIPLIHRGHQ